MDLGRDPGHETREGGWSSRWEGTRLCRVGVLGGGVGWAAPAVRRKGAGNDTYPGRHDQTEQVTACQGERIRRRSRCQGRNCLDDDRQDRSLEVTRWVIAHHHEMVVAGELCREGHVEVEDTARVGGECPEMHRLRSRIEVAGCSGLKPGSAPFDGPFGDGRGAGQHDPGVDRNRRRRKRLIRADEEIPEDVRRTSRGNDCSSGRSPPAIGFVVVPITCCVPIGGWLVLVGSAVVAVVCPPVGGAVEVVAAAA